MVDMQIFKKYAAMEIPNASLPDSVLLTHTDDTLTIFDAYPKAVFHFLVLPRIKAPLTPKVAENLRTLLQWDKIKAKELLEIIKRDAEKVKAMVEAEMVNLYGGSWPIWIGFHSIPSIGHLHLHVVSADLHSASLKNKRHYNSFHPKIGFFLHLDDVLEWFDATDSYFESTAKLPATKYDPMLKESLVCWKCGQPEKTMPALKNHLKAEWEKERRSAIARQVRKKRPRQDDSDNETQPPAKKVDRQKSPDEKD